MDEWQDITITGRDKQLSEQPNIEDSELSRQFFTLSVTPPAAWAQICNGMLISELGRSFRKAEVKGRHLVIWGGQNTFLTSATPTTSRIWWPMSTGDTARRRSRLISAASTHSTAEEPRKGRSPFSASLRQVYRGVRLSR